MGAADRITRASWPISTRRSASTKRTSTPASSVDWRGGGLAMRSAHRMILTRCSASTPALTSIPIARNRTPSDIRMMRLTIDGAAREFIPIKTYRQAHDLPPEFGVALFEPKDYAGLGRIDQAGAELNEVRAAVLAAIPPRLTIQQWMSFAPDLTRLFTDKLYEINPNVRLHDVEIEFAAAGFADVCQAVIYARLRDANPPPFEAIY